MKWETRRRRWKSKRTRRLHALDMRRLRAGGPQYALKLIHALNRMTDWETEMHLLYGNPADHADVERRKAEIAAIIEAW